MANLGPGGIMVNLQYLEVPDWLPDWATFWAWHCCVCDYILEL